MAQNFTAQLIEHVAIDATPNVVIGSTVSDEEILALLASEETLEEDAGHEASAGDVEVIDPDLNDIDSMLAGIDMSIEATATEAVTVIEPELGLEALAEVVAAAESTEIAASVSTKEEISEGEKPTTAEDRSNVEVLSADDALSDLHDELAKITTDDKEVLPAETAAEEKKPKTEKKPKAERTVVPRKHYTDKVERLVDRVGDDLSGVSMLTPADATLDPKEALERTLHIIKGMNKKEQSRASNLVEFVTGKRTSMNNVLDRVIRLLHKDGFVTTGDKGTVMEDLLAKPYSPASARAMGANTVAVFADMMLLKADGKGRYVANPESVLLTICKQKMGLV